MSTRDWCIGVIIYFIAATIYAFVLHFNVWEMLLAMFATSQVYWYGRKYLQHRTIR